MGEEGTAVGEICRKAGISEARFYNWRKKYGGLMPSEMKRLRQLEEENGKLKKTVADRRSTRRCCTADIAAPALQRGDRMTLANDRFSREPEKC
jgi:hypothetical protein